MNRFMSDEDKNSFNWILSGEFFRDMLQVNQQFFLNYFNNITGYWHDDKDMALTYLTFYNKLIINPREYIKLHKQAYEFISMNSLLFENYLKSLVNKEKSSEALIIPQTHDKRFNAAEWEENPHYNYIKQFYLLWNKYGKKIIDEAEIDLKKRRKLNFYTSQFLDALAPGNFFITNPTAQKLALSSGGNSIMLGLKNFIDDLKKGRISQTDNQAFQVGKNLAYTKGSVIYQNDLIQLIHYLPNSSKIKEIPLLIVPPWINKYYILDLQEHNSFVKYAVNQGFNVFMISWKNPQPGALNFSFDDYVEKGVISASEVVMEIASSKNLNVLGYCLGGTLLAVSAAVLKNRKKNWINSMSFLATMLDFSDVGPMGDVIDEALVRKLERGELRTEGVMRGEDMEKAFNLIRANDLIWNYVENNYLLGKKPPSFDVLFWTNDNTNLPADMYIYYLRNMVLENKLSIRNALTIAGEPINLRNLEIPAFVVGTIEDHISPCKTTFATTELLKGPVTYILGGSGHVMGIANPPSKKKYGYWSEGMMNEGFEKWKDTAQYHEGSWWIPWSNWLEENSGKIISVKIATGSKLFPEMESAPGSYVMEKINHHN